MPRLSPCLGLPGYPCGTPCSGPRCPTCERGHQQQRNARRTHYHGGWEQQSKQARAAHIADFGMVCFGLDGIAHPARELELDHTTGAVLCHRCNVAAGPAHHP